MHTFDKIRNKVAGQTNEMGHRIDELRQEFNFEGDFHFDLLKRAYADLLDAVEELIEVDGEVGKAKQVRIDLYKLRSDLL